MISLRRFLALPLAAAFALPSAAQNPLELLVQQQSHYWFSVESLSQPSEFMEAADDFDLVASIERVRALGKHCFSCVPGDLHSVRLAFYEWTPSGPGALQQEYVFQDGDPNLAYGEGPNLIDMTLPTPFVATGPHFMSVQLDVDGYWAWSASNYGQPNGSMIWTRSEATGSWAKHQIINPVGDNNADLAFELYGTDSTPPDGGTDPAGEWTVVATPGPTDGFGVFLRDVDALAEDDAWAVGSYTKSTGFGSYDTFSWIQHWDGTEWSFVPSPNPEPYPGGGYITLSAVDAVAPDDVWAAGTYKTVAPDGFLGFQIFVVHWDGSSWTQVAAPATSGGSGPSVYDIEVVGPDDIWFFGLWLDFQLSALGEQRALAMHWDGSGFTVIDPPFFDNQAGYGGGHTIESASALASDDIWAVGGAHGPDFTPHSYITHWDGTSWQHVPGPTPGFYNRLYAVEAIAPDDVWAAGYYQDATSGYKHLYLHWDGSSWTQVDAPGGGKTLLHRPASGDVIAAGGINTTDGIFRWDGTTWQPVMDFPTVPNPNITRFALVPDTGQVWGVGRQNGPNAGGLTVRFEPQTDAALLASPDPCGSTAPPFSLLASPPPILGSNVSFAVDDPLSAATVAPGSAVFLAVAREPSPGSCGTLLPGFGPDLALGELLLANTDWILPMATWGGPENPAVFNVAVPNAPVLLGETFRAQAAFFDPFDGDIVLTEAIDLTLGH